MKRFFAKWTLTATLAALSVFLFSCSEDDPVRTNNGGGGGDPNGYQNLTKPEHVLHNLELAYNDQDITRYRELIDIDEFIFYFASGEPQGQWTREQDDISTENMFAGKESNDPRYGKITDIAYTLDDEGPMWVEVVEPGFENETWQKIVVPYEYSIDIEPDWTIINGKNAAAAFTVRQVFDAVDNRNEWRLVRWEDKGFPVIRRTSQLQGAGTQ